MHLWLLIKDAWNTKSVKDKFRIWLMPTGWRPADVAEKYPVYKIQDVYRFKKYDTVENPLFIGYAWIQMVVLLLTISFFFANIAKIGSPGMFVYGGFIFLFVYALTELMDNNPTSWVWELSKSLYGMGILYYSGDWFGLNQYVAMSNYFILAYFGISLLLCFYFLQINKMQRFQKV